MKLTSVQLEPGHAITIATNERFCMRDSGGFYRLASGDLALQFPQQKQGVFRYFDTSIELGIGHVFWLDGAATGGGQIHFYCREECRLECLGEEDQQFLQPSAIQWLCQLYRQISLHSPWDSCAQQCRAGELSCEANDTFCVNSPTGTWCIVTGDELALSLNDDLKFTSLNSSVVFPANHALTLHTHSPCMVKIVDFSEIQIEQIRFSFFEAQRIFLEICQRNLLLEEADHNNRLNGRFEKEKLQLERALESLSRFSPLNNKIDLHGSELAVALSALGREKKIQFKLPSEWNENDELEYQLDVVATSSGARIRKLQLPDDWHELDMDSFLAVRSDTGKPVAVINENKSVGCRYVLVPGSRDEKFSELKLEKNVYTFAVPFHETGEHGLLKYVFGMIVSMRKEFLWLILFSIIALGVGLFQPLASKIIVEDVIPNAGYGQLFEIGVTFGLLAIFASIFFFLQNIFALRISIKAVWQLQNGIIDRTLRLRPGFFRSFSAGDLWNRLAIVTRIGEQLNNASLSTALAGIFSILFLIQCFIFSAKLALVSLATVVAFVAIILVQSIWVRKVTVRTQELNGKMFGYSDQLVRAVSKLRVAGAEQRAVKHWCTRYSSLVTELRKLLFIRDIGDITVPVVTTASQLILLYLAATMLVSNREGAAVLTVGVFFAFNAAYQQLLSNTSRFAEESADLIGLVFERKLIAPILAEDVEDTPSAKETGFLRGGISFRNICFRYSPDSPQVLKELNLDIPGGSFSAIVGSSGAGKSTILRLILGFDQPDAGAVYFDDVDLQGLNPRAVRRQIGTVLQTSHLPAGRVFDIVCGNLALDEAEVWRALESVGLAEDVRATPAQLMMRVGDDAGTLSGGQRQRLLVARALAASPRILLLDEATSALDNQTQKVVADNLANMNMTRIVVAHRLSTIKDADLIYVIDNGSVCESGNYAELMKAKGKFHELARRQLGCELQV